jgi:hypothetical protein
MIPWASVAAENVPLGGLNKGHNFVREVSAPLSRALGGGRVLESLATFLSMLFWLACYAPAEYFLKLGSFSTAARSDSSSWCV